MKPNTPKVPSIVVIQERHVRHGENFKIFKVSCKSRREYIAKFMSSRKITYRCKSRKVRIGCGFKETTYKGSPLAVSRLLLLEGLNAAFPTFEEHKRMDTYANRSQADSSKNSSPLSFFNLSDKRSMPSLAPTFKMPNPLGGLAGSDSQEVDLSNTEKNCSPDKIADFNLIFGSDTNDAEDFDSDNDDQDKVSVQIVSDPVATTSKSPTGEATEKQGDSNIMVSLERMEKNINQIVSAFGAAQNQAPSRQAIEELPVAESSNVANNISDQKPSLSVPPNPLAMRRNRVGHNVMRLFNDLPPLNPPAFRQPKMARLNPQMKRSAPVLIHSDQYVHSASSDVGVSGRQVSFRNPQHARISTNNIEPNGSIPFFTVPGGCFMVIHATNQTTPALHATFVTGCSNALQFQQMHLPVFGAHQIVAIHLGPYRLDREEINVVYSFARETREYTPCFPPRYK